MFTHFHASRPDKFLFGLVFCIVLSGCTVGPNYVAEKIKLPREWEEAIAQPGLQSAPELSSYWKRLGDPELNDLVALAVDNNRDLKIAALRIDEALAFHRFERAGHFPEIDLDFSAQRRRRSEAVASAITTPRNDFFSFGSLLRWELDLLGRVRRLNEAAAAEVEATTELYQSTLVTLLAEVASDYIRYRTLTEEIHLTERNIDTQRGSLKLASERFAAGVAPEVDVRQAESNLGATEAVLPRLRVAQVQTLNRLAVLCGGHPEDLRDRFGSTENTLSLPKLDSQTLPLNLLRRRPDLRVAERLLAAQHARIGASQAELLPIISLNGQFSFQSLDQLEDAFEATSRAYAIGPFVTWNLLDFGRRSSVVEQQESRTEQLRMSYQQQVLRAIQEVEDALVALSEEQKRSRFLDRSVVASRRSAELVRALYVNGLTDFQNVLDTEQRLFQTENALAESRGAALEAFVALFRALGGSWGSEEEATLKAGLS